MCAQLRFIYVVPPLYLFSALLYKMFRSHIVDSMGTTSTGKGVHLGDKDATGIAKALRRAV